MRISELLVQNFIVLTWNLSAPIQEHSSVLGMASRKSAKWYLRSASGSDGQLYAQHVHAERSLSLIRIEVVESKNEQLYQIRGSLLLFTVTHFIWLGPSLVGCSNGLTVALR